MKCCPNEGEHRRNILVKRRMPIGQIGISHRLLVASNKSHFCCISIFLAFTIFARGTASSAQSALDAYNFQGASVLESIVKKNSRSPSINRGFRTMAADIGVPKDVKEDPDFIKLSAQIQILLAYIDFDIALYREKKHLLDEKHEKALRYNTIANLLVSGASGIVPAAFAYPGTGISDTVSSSISISGSGLASGLSVLALKKQADRARVQESRIIAEILSGHNSDFFPTLIVEFLDTCKLSQLGYIGQKLLRSPADTDSTAKDWLLKNWKSNFGNSVKAIQARSAANMNEKLFSLSTQELDERITMLSQTRVLFESIFLSRQIAADYKLARRD